MTDIGLDLQTIRDRLTPKQPDDATILEYLQSEPEPIEQPTEAPVEQPSQSPIDRICQAFMWLDNNALRWMDTRSGQYIAYCFLAGILIWSVSLLIPSEKRTNAALRQVYEYCKQN